MKRILWVLSIGSILASCQSSGGADYTIKAEDYSAADFPAIQLVKSITYVQLDSEKILDVISKVEKVGDVFIVASTNGLYEFQADGKFIREISHRGRAENEWARLNTFYISPDDNHIFVIDSFQKKVMEFDLEGNYLGIERVNGNELYEASDAVLSDNGERFICHNVFDNYGAILTIGEKTLYDFKPKTAGISQKIGTHPISMYGGDITFVAPLDNKIYCIKNDRLHLRYQIDDSRNQLSRQQLRGIKDFSIDTYFNLMNNNMSCGYTGIFETSSYIFLPFFNLGLTVLDKNNESAHYIRYSKEQKPSFVPMKGLVGCSGDTLICALQPLAIKSIVSNGKMLDDEILQFSSIADSLSITDNCYLFFVTVDDQQ